MDTLKLLGWAFAGDIACLFLYVGVFKEPTLLALTANRHTVGILAVAGCRPRNVTADFAAPIGSLSWPPPCAAEPQPTRSYI